ncbi:Crp/Fnr family transcriptional regulator [Oceanobacillus manasiensis]|uniref:Crp/Fnr family transcriptional regulator n=1 Tax=Oceanobacillus manasiensis TaxID=586413 RepID=UPI0005A89D68|nr:Crp/Fnr family transcriptional regulator [Oceanobacillus manasiensis]
MKEILIKYMADYTSLSELQQHSIMEELVIEKFKKGTYLIKQQDFTTKKCFFVLKGCVRQYHLDEAGNEITSNFYTEEQAILLNYEDADHLSKYALTCVEDCVLVVADLESEQKMYMEYSGLESMTHRMMENYLCQTQDEFTTFIHSSPEARYKTITQSRPDLLKRVPQHQLASYLGMTPESLSRIKKRIQ